MNLLAQVTDAVFATDSAPQYLYVQRHLFAQLLAELSQHVPYEAEQLVNTTKLFGLPVVWVQCTNHPNVRAI